MNVRRDRPYLVLVEHDGEKLPALVALEAIVRPLDPRETTLELSFIDTERDRVFVGHVLKNDDFTLVLGGLRGGSTQKLTLLPLTEQRFKEHLATRSEDLDSLEKLLRVYNTRQSWNERYVPVEPFEEEEKSR